MNDDAIRRQREADLITYYDNEVSARTDRQLPEWRIDQRSQFVKSLLAEQRTLVLEIGSGPGRDALALAEAGLDYRGVDLAPASVAACRERGFDVQVASVLDLPFEANTFDAGWTMSTLLHVGDADLPAALAEIGRVLKPGAPLVIGLWGHPDGQEGAGGDDDYGPARFFSLRTDAQLHDQLRRLGPLEHTSRHDVDGPFHYQWAVVRIPA